MTVLEIISLILTGFLAGTLGGMLGVGGSILIIPALTILLHKNQQLSQAAAMQVNVCVAAAALLRHHRAGAVFWAFWRRMLPAGFIAIVIGVMVSNTLDHLILELLFGLFLAYVIAVNIRKLVTKKADFSPDSAHPAWTTATFVGTIMGFSAGLLGIGGGIIAVPLMQRFARLPLRQCIGTSAAVMCLTSVVGAATKNRALSGLVDSDGISLQLTYDESLILAICLAPTAILGGFLGGGLTHRLPIRWIRVAFILLLSVACVRFLMSPFQ